MKTLSLSRLKAAVCLHALLLCSTLTAQDFFNSGVSARTAANAGIFNPSAASALDSLSQNPAGLALLDTNVVDLSVIGALARGSFSNATNAQSLMRFNAGLVPFGAVGLPLAHSRWTLGVGFIPDLLSSSKWQFNDAPGTAGANYGPQRETSAILAFRIPVGLSYRVHPRIQVGMTAAAIFNSNTLVMPYVFQSHPTLRGLKTLLDLHTRGVGWNTSYGAIVRVSRRVDLAGSYRTRSSITSTGSSSGDLSAQFAAVGLAAPSTFRYNAQVRVQLPQVATVAAYWQKSPALRLSAESSWTGWNGSFHNLPVSLTQGSNAAVNDLLQSSSLRDVVPLNWKDQFSFRAGVERSVTERLSVSGGFSHANNPVPSSTLSPLTAAIMSNGVSTGAGYVLGRRRLDLAYRINLPNRQSVNHSALHPDRRRR